MELLYEVITNRTFEEAITSIENALAKRGFGVLWRLNFKDKLKEKGLEFDYDFMIMEVCNPKQAKEVLSRHLDVGYFLPCKMIVYEDDIAVKIGFIKPEQLIGMLNYNDLDPYAKEVETIMIESVNEAK